MSNYIPIASIVILVFCVVVGGKVANHIFPTTEIEQPLVPDQWTLDDQETLMRTLIHGKTHYIVTGFSKSGKSSLVNVLINQNVDYASMQEPAELLWRGKCKTVTHTSKNSNIQVVDTQGFWFLDNYSRAPMNNHNFPWDKFDKIFVAVNYGHVEYYLDEYKKLPYEKVIVVITHCDTTGFDTITFKKDNKRDPLLKEMEKAYRMISCSMQTDRDLNADILLKQKRTKLLRVLKGMELITTLETLHESTNIPVDI